MSPIGRIKLFPYPKRIDSIESAGTYLKKLYRSLTEEQVESLTDFENMDIDSLQVSDLTISTSFKPTADATVDLGAVGTAPAPDYRFRHLYLSGNLSDETNTLTVANAKTAYDNRVDTWGDGLQISSFTASVDYNTTNLKITSTELDTIQGIATNASPTFAGLTVVNAINEFSTDGTMGGNSNGAVPTEAAVVTYVAAQITAEDLDFAGDTGTGAIDLNSQTFTLTGTDPIDTAASSQTLTISHKTTSGNIHVPASGASAQILQYSSAGTAKWATVSSEATIADGGAITLGGSPTFNGITIADGYGIGLQEDITFTGATTENLIKMPDNLLDALSIQEGASNKYVTFDTVNDEEDIFFYKSVDILHTATHADDHALEIDTDAANLGDVKAIDLDYITGSISQGEDEGIILINIDETQAGAGSDVFGLEVLATDGSAGIYGMKVGVVIGPIHQDSGTFIDPDTGTDNTTTNGSPPLIMIDGSTGTTTDIFEHYDEYIIIGDAAVFEEIEFILTTGASGGGIKPTFWYSIATAPPNQWTQFTPVDGTDGFKHTGVVAWDASDLTSHAQNSDTNTFDIKIVRTRGEQALTTFPVLGYARTAATTEYIWNANGDVNIRKLAISTVVNAGTDTDKFLVLDGSDNVDFRTGANVLSDIGGESADATIVKDADFGSAGLCATNGSGTYSIVTDNSTTWDGLISCTFANVDTALAAANSAVDFNSQNLTSVGTVGCGAITSGNIIIPDAGNIGSTTDTDAIAISSGGAVTISAGQLTFPASQNASADANTLDDYEEGTWTPDLQFGGAKVGITYDVQSGLYTKIGNQVAITGFFILSSKGSSNGDARMYGLPFTVKNDDGAYSPINSYFDGISFADFIESYASKSTTYVLLAEITNAGVKTNITDANFGNNSLMLFSAVYFV